MDQIEEGIHALKKLYFQEVLSHRTRSVWLPGRKCDPIVMSTFLGFELKAGRKRITCPDIATARYLKVFTELGFKEVKIPYDPTRTARILPSLEQSFALIKKCVLNSELSESERRKLQRRIYSRIRNRLRDRD